MKQLDEKQLRSWLEECYRTGCTHMLLVVDRDEDFNVFPVKVHSYQDVSEVESFYRNQPETDVVEVYSMFLSLEEQLEESFNPVFNYV
jgi:hypothetical protein